MKNVTIEGVGDDGKTYKLQIDPAGVVRWVDLQVIRKNKPHYRNLYVSYGAFAKPMSKNVLRVVTKIRKEKGV